MILKTIEANTQEELQIKINHYMTDYHPTGYGTTVRERYENGNKFYAVISRSGSCD